jgi:hypothetical protein
MKILIKNLAFITLIIGALFATLTLSVSAATISFVDNTTGQTTINNHQLESTGNWGNFAEDVSSSSFNLQSGAPGYRLSGRIQIGGMTANTDGDTSWAEVNLSPTIPAIDTTFGWDTGINMTFSGSSTSGSAGIGYDFWLREGTSNLGYFNTSNNVRSNFENETSFPPDPKSVFFDFLITVVPSGASGGTAYLDVSYGGSSIGSLSGSYTTDLSTAYVYAGLWNGEIGQSEFAFLDYSFGGTEGQLDLSAVPIPGAFWMLGSGLIGLIAVRRRLRN